MDHAGPWFSNPFSISNSGSRTLRCRYTNLSDPRQQSSARARIRERLAPARTASNTWLPASPRPLPDRSAEGRTSNLRTAPPLRSIDRRCCRLRTAIYRQLFGCTLCRVSSDPGSGLLKNREFAFDRNHIYGSHRHGRLEPVPCDDEARGRCACLHSSWSARRLRFTRAPRKHPVLCTAVTLPVPCTKAPCRAPCPFLRCIVLTSPLAMVYAEFFRRQLLWHEHHWGRRPLVLSGGRSIGHSAARKLSDECSHDEKHSIGSNVHRFGEAIPTRLLAGDRITERFLLYPQGHEPHPEKPA